MKVGKVTPFGQNVNGEFLPLDTKLSQWTCNHVGKRKPVHFTLPGIAIVRHGEECEVGELSQRRTAPRERQQFKISIWLTFCPLGLPGGATWAQGSEMGQLMHMWGPFGGLCVKFSCSMWLKGSEWSPKRLQFYNDRGAVWGPLGLQAL